MEDLAFLCGQLLRAPRVDDHHEHERADSFQFGVAVHTRIHDGQVADEVEEGKTNFFGCSVVVVNPYNGVFVDIKEKIEGLLFVAAASVLDALTLAEQTAMLNEE